MRKLTVFMMTTLDGFFAGPHGELDWHVVDEEFNAFAVEQLNAVDTLVFGRVTYEGMAGYWPTEAAKTDDPVIAEKMNAMPKIVCSRTLDKADWQNTRLVKGQAAEEIAALKQQPGRDLIIFGSSNLSASLLALGLIDEFRIMVNPVLLGAGRTLFNDGGAQVPLQRVQVRPFRSGNVLLYYQPVARE